MLRTGCAAAMLLAASPALAEEAREFCADRPGLGTPACTLAPGSAMLEVGIAAWDRSRDAQAVTDGVTLGDALLRVGVSSTTEVQLGLTGHVIQRERDRASAAAHRVAGLGDGTLAVRQSISAPDGPVAIQAYLTVPLAKRPIGSRDWSGGVLLPIGFELPAGFALDLTPQLAIAPNEGRAGHHLAWGGVVGLTYALGERLSLTGEVGALRDADPGGHTTDARVAASLAWQVYERLQLDFEADLGLSAGAPDHFLAVGFAWQFR